MTTINLLSATLGLAAPWEMTSARFSDTENRVDMIVEYVGGSTLPCPSCGIPAEISSISHETWHHRTFFRFSAYLHARVPRIDCGSCGPKQVPPSWSNRRSGFVPLANVPSP